jgi:DNA-binding CsgD family transcriptional regulator
MSSDRSAERVRKGFEDEPPATVEDAVARLRLLAEADAAGSASASAVQRRRFETPLRVHAALGALRAGATSPGELVAAAPQVVCEACGFSRSLISRVHGSRWKPDRVWSDPAVVPGAVRASFERYVDETEIPLEHLMLEAELARTRRPALVSEPLTDDRTFKGIIVASETDSYVVAPIAPTGRVIGFLHADRLGQGRTVDARDRENLWMFAEHFGLLFERLVLVGRLEQQRAQLKDALREAGRHIDEACSAEIELAREEPVDLERDRRPVRAATARATTRLTARETEVLELLAEGRSNSEIARLLVVSEATVKSRLGRLLRKLGASTRAEAVARYLHHLDEAAP